MEHENCKRSRFLVPTSHPLLSQHSDKSDTLSVSFRCVTGKGFTYKKKREGGGRASYNDRKKLGLLFYYFSMIAVLMRRLGLTYSTVVGDFLHGRWNQPRNFFGGGGGGFFKID